MIPVDLFSFSAPALRTLMFGTHQAIVRATLANFVATFRSDTLPWTMESPSICECHSQCGHLQGLVIDPLALLYTTSQQKMALQIAVIKYMEEAAGIGWPEFYFEVGEQVAPAVASRHRQVLHSLATSSHLRHDSAEASSCSADADWVKAAHRSMHADTELVKRLVISLRQHAHATAKVWGLKAHDVASQADSLIDMGIDSWHIVLPEGTVQDPELVAIERVGRHCSMCCNLS